MTLKPSSQQRARRATPCHRHPAEPVTGLCAPCLRERLSHLSPSPSNLSSKPSTSVTAAAAASPSSSSSTLPELRRCKTFSGKKCESIVLSYEPRRRSCEVRVRNTLSALFNLDDEGNDLGGKCEVESKNLGLLRCTCPVLELKEEENEDDDDGVIRASNVVVVENNEQILDEFEESKTMKEYIDLEFKSNKPSRRDFKEIAGSFWIAASVFSRKLQKWKRKHNSTIRRVDGDGGVTSAAGNGGLGEMRLERLKGRRLRDTQSEVGEYGVGRRSCDTDNRFSVDLGRSSIDGRLSIDLLGRRSCDTDSRFSIDLGRASVDDGGRALVSESKCSIDPPRASWDGYFSGRTMVRGNAPMVSVIENAMATVYGFDDRALAEEKVNKVKEDEADYGESGYLDGIYLQRQRKGFDRCNSKRNMLVKLNDESKVAMDAKVSPAGIEVFHGTKLLITEKELKDLRLSSLKDDSSESFETASKDVASVSSSSNGKGFKKCRQWTKLWSIWGLLHRRKCDKCSDEEKISGQNVECSLAVSSEEIASEVKGDVRLDANWKLLRSHSTSSVSGLVPQKNSRNETTGLKGKKREEVVLDRNWSARYSPNNLDNGLLRFYLAPLKSSRRSKLGKSRSKKSHSIARTVVRLH
ncbi:hypothetical protein Ancab_011527 [Ancistrocladus abbreviatus]